jgi:hypothetical protein
VNEPLGDDPADVLTVRPQLPPPDTLDDIDDSEREPLLKARREGLPPGFRMRHDKHYVEELMSTPTIGPGAASTTSPRPNIPTVTATVVDDRRAAADASSRPSVAAVELIADRLEAVVAHGAIARTQAPDLIGRTVQAELQRVSRFARAVAIGVRQTDPIRRTVTAGEIAAAIRAACTRVARLNGVQCVVTTDDGEFAVAVDRALVVQSIAGTVDALLDLALVNGEDDGLDEDRRITVSLQAVKVRPALIIDVAWPTLTWRGAPAHRFFDNKEQDFVAAPAAGILLATAGHVVRLHGGRVEAQLQGGVSIRYVLPQESPRATSAS